MEDVDIPKPEWRARQAEELGVKSAKHALEQTYTQGPVKPGPIPTSTGLPPVSERAAQGTLPVNVIATPEIDQARIDSLNKAEEKAASRRNWLQNLLVRNRK